MTTALAETASDFLPKRDAGAARPARGRHRGAARRSGTTLRDLGWLGLHVPEEHGGSGFGLPELVVVVEELGRAVAPGPFVPDGDRQRGARRGRRRRGPEARWLPGLADGSTAGAVAARRRGGRSPTASASRVGRRRARRRAADVLLVPVGDDVAVVDAVGDGVTVESPPPTSTPPGGRRASRSTARPPRSSPAARQALVDLARHDPRRPRRSASPASAPSWPREYAKVREQFGRPIAMYQAVKHHCANMLVATELATAAVWDAARAAADRRRPALAHAAAVAATLALPAADLCANLNIQVHGGIGFTWEHDAHLYLRRATAARRRIARRRGGGARRHRPDPRAACADAARSTCRPRPSRSATRCARSPTGSRTSTPPRSATR